MPFLRSVTGVTLSDEERSELQINKITDRISDCGINGGTC
jgi:hypothetical protein